MKKYNGKVHVWQVKGEEVTTLLFTKASERENLPEQFGKEVCLYLGTLTHFETAIRQDLHRGEYARYSGVTSSKTEEEPNWGKVKRALINIRYVRNLFRPTPSLADISESLFGDVLERLEKGVQELETVLLSKEIDIPKGLSEEERLQQHYMECFGKNFEVVDKYRGKPKLDVLYRYGVIESDEGLFAVTWQDIGDRGKFPWKAVPITKEEHKEIKEDPEPHTKIIELLTEKDDIL